MHFIRENSSLFFVCRTQVGVKTWCQRAVLLSKVKYVTAFEHLKKYVANDFIKYSCKKRGGGNVIED